MKIPIDHSEERDDSNNASIRVFIPTLKISNLHVPKEMQYLSELRDFIYDMYDIPQQRQKWIYNGKLIKEDIDLLTLNASINRKSSIENRNIDKIIEEKSVENGIQNRVDNGSNKVMNYSELARKRKNIVALTLIGSVPTTSTMKSLSITDILKYVVKFLRISELKRLQFVSRTWLEIVRQGSLYNLDRYYWICHSVGNIETMNDLNEIQMIEENEINEEMIDEDDFQEFDDEDIEDVALEQERNQPTRNSNGNLSEISCIDLLSSKIIYKIQDVQVWCNEEIMLERNRKNIYHGTSNGIIIRNDNIEYIDVQNGNTIWNFKLSSLQNNALEAKFYLLASGQGNQTSNQSNQLSTNWTVPSFLTNIPFNELLLKFQRIIMDNRESLLDHREENNDLLFGYEILARSMLSYIGDEKASSIFSQDKIMKSEYDPISNRVYVQFKTCIIALNASDGSYISTFTPCESLINFIVVLNSPFVLVKGQIAISILEKTILLLDSNLNIIRLIPTYFRIVSPFFEHDSEEFGQIFVMSHHSGYTVVSKDWKIIGSISADSFQLTENYIISLDRKESLDLDTMKNNKLFGDILSNSQLGLAYDKDYLQGCLIATKKGNANPYSNNFSIPQDISYTISKIEVEEGLEQSSFRSQFNIGKNEIVYRKHPNWNVDNSRFMYKFKCQFMHNKVLTLWKDIYQVSEENSIYNPDHLHSNLITIRKTEWKIKCLGDDSGMLIWQSTIPLPQESEVLSLEVIQETIFVWWRHRSKLLLVIYNEFGNIVYKSVSPLQMMTPKHIVRDV